MVKSPITKEDFISLQLITLKELLTLNGVNFHVASLNLEPVWFSKNKNCIFQVTCDDLEKSLIACFNLNGTPIALQQYVSQKNKGVSILFNQSVVDKKTVMENFLKELKLDSSLVSWSHDILKDLG